MTLKIKSILSLLLAFLLTFAACSAAPHKERVQPPMSERILQIAQGMKKLAGVEEGDCLLNASDEFPAGSSVCDWAALACAVGGAEDSYTAYLHALEAYVKINSAKIHPSAEQPTTTELLLRCSHLAVTRQHFRRIKTENR